MPPAIPDPHDHDALCAEVRIHNAAAEERLDALRTARRELAELNRELDLAAHEADRHGTAERKTALAVAWRTAMAAAPDEATRQAATATWMGNVSELNRRTRSALRRLAAGRLEAIQLERRVAQAELDARAARIRAEAAEAACESARRKRVERDEQLVLEARAAARSAAAQEAGSDGVAELTMVADPAAEAGAVIGEGPDGEPADAVEGTTDDAAPVAAVARRPADSDVVLGLMAGDPVTHQAIAAELGEMHGQLPARYLLLLDTLVEEVTVAAVDAGALAFTPGHPLWSQLSPEEGRLVMRGLRDLGFRLDLHDGWYGGRAPTPNDLASALGFAGLDVRAVRGLPTSAELRELPSSVLVAAHDHLRERAPDLTLDEMTRLLGQRAPRLNELWDDWGRVRPILSGELPVRA